MKVLILAAGYGTRLYPLVKDTPKALLEVQGKPIVDYILENAKGIKNISEIVLVTNDKFFKTFQSWKEAHARTFSNIHIINDQTQTSEDRLGSIGDIQHVLEVHPFDEDLLVVGGDNLFDVSLNGFADFARIKENHVSIGVYKIDSLEQAKNFGVVTISQQKKIMTFEEKPENPKSTLIAMCLYYFPKKTLGLIGQYLLESGKSDRAGDYIRWLCKKSEVYGFQFEGNWYDIGSIESYKDAQKNFKMNT
jgi:glucose-1-phosphate thymidylyltransferase